MSVTTLAANSVVCADTILFQDNFDLIAVNTNNWIIEQYIPSVPVSLFHLLRILITHFSREFCSLIWFSILCSYSVAENILTFQFLVHNVVLLYGLQVVI